MMSRSALVAALVVSTFAAPALAQQPASTGAQTGQEPADAPAPAASAAPAAPKKDPTPMAGYAYGDKNGGDKVVVRSAPRARRAGPTGPAVNMPGFEPLADGGSRLFVQVSQSVPVEERKTAGSITYVLKGASPRVWNNTNALVTVHFNTPVSRARLVPQGKDLLFIVELRAGATPTWKMSDAPDRGAMLAIDFPKGDYLDANGQPLQVTAPAPETKTPKKPARAARSAGGGGAGPKP